MSKIITINPELFKMKKTKKKPLINPKLINKTINKTLINRIKNTKPDKPDKPAGKFDDSEQFLSNILQKYPKNETMKVHRPLNNCSLTPIDKTVEKLLFNPSESMNYKLDCVTPYGNLKRGLKPTYKNWKLGKKVQHPTHYKEVKYCETEEAKRIMESEINKAINGKTEFSTDLLAKHDANHELIISDEEVILEPEVLVSENLTETLPSISLESLDVFPPISTNVEPKPVQNVECDPSISINVEDKPVQNVFETKAVQNVFETKAVQNVFETKAVQNVFESKPVENVETKVEPHPDIVIKPNLEEFETVNVEVNQTVKRKFSVGKKNGRVGVIIPNKQTRKDISEFLKNLKKTPYEETRKKLKKQGLIQVGSSAPQELVRKIYENSELAGIINNENSDVLMNNLLNDN